jgi:hypothetical protein
MYVFADFRKFLVLKKSLGLQINKVQIRKSQKSLDLQIVYPQSAKFAEGSQTDKLFPSCSFQVLPPYKFLILSSNDNNSLGLPVFSSFLKSI